MGVRTYRTSLYVIRRTALRVMRLHEMAFLRDEFQHASIAHVPELHQRLRMRHPKILAYAVVVAASAFGATSLGAQSGPPSRPPVKGCTWERAISNTLGLSAWVQRCDFGHRKIQHFFKGNALVQQYSDGSTVDTVIDVFDLRPNESAPLGIQRLFVANTDRVTSSKCVIAPYNTGKAPPSTQRYQFVPNLLYERELKAKANPNEVPEPPCGKWGVVPDGVEYFLAWPNAAVRKVLYVRIGQDEPLFDEATLQITSPQTAPRKP